MDLLIAYGALAVVGLLFSLAGRRAVSLLSDGAINLSPHWLFAAGVIPAGILLGSGAGYFDQQFMLLGVIVLLMMMLAVTDMRSAWAPNCLTYTLIVAAAAFTINASLVLTGLGAIGCLAAYKLIQTWYPWVNERLPYCPPPVDILAFALGPVVLGFSTQYALAMSLSSLLLIVARQAPNLTGRLFDKSVFAGAAADLGYEDHMGAPIPLLAILFPCYVLGVLVSGYGLLPF